MNINILGMNYTIERSSLALTHRDYGNYSPSELKICVERDLLPDLHNRTMFHEIIHAALYETGNNEEYQNERLVDNLAIALYQCLRDCGALNMDCELLKKPPHG